MHVMIVVISWSLSTHVVGNTVIYSYFRTELRPYLKRVLFHPSCPWPQYFGFSVVTKSEVHQFVPEPKVLQVRPLSKNNSRRELSRPDIVPDN